MNIARKKYGCELVYPTFKNVENQPIDFNELDYLEGLKKVIEKLEHSKLEDDWPELLPIKSELLPVELLSLENFPKLLWQRR